MKFRSDRKNTNSTNTENAAESSVENDGQFLKDNLNTMGKMHQLRAQLDLKKSKLLKRRNNKIIDESSEAYASTSNADDDNKSSKINKPFFFELCESPHNRKRNQQQQKPILGTELLSTINTSTKAMHSRIFYLPLTKQKNDLLRISSSADDCCSSSSAKSLVVEKKHKFGLTNTAISHENKILFLKELSLYPSSSSLLKHIQMRIAHDSGFDFPIDVPNYQTNRRKTRNCTRKKQSNKDARSTPSNASLEKNSYLLCKIASNGKQ